MILTIQIINDIVILVLAPSVALFDEVSFRARHFCIHF